MTAPSPAGPRLGPRLGPPAQDWLAAALADAGASPTGPIRHHHTQAWSSVWHVPTGQGRFWFKQCGPTHAAEGRVHRALAAIAPGHLDAPAAIEPDRRWILSRDGGTTMFDTEPATRGIEVDTVAAMLADYARFQRATLTHRDTLTRAGIRHLDPSGAARLAAEQAAAMAAFPDDDPRHLTTRQHRAVTAALDDLEAAGRALAAGPVPGAVDHGDLWPQNILLPRSPGAPYRVFDLADAAWSHPFTSLVMVAVECRYRWQVEQPDDAVNLDDPRIRTVFDAYLREWTDLAPLPRLRDLTRHALRIAPLHRSSVWLDILRHADPDGLARHGSTPWAWLEDVTKPVHL